MKKQHGPIPDFSGKKKDSGMRVPPGTKTQAPPHVPPPRAGKPQATSQKSGRRGS